MAAIPFQLAKEVLMDFLENPYHVLIEWVDGHVEDTSDFVVDAENERDAILFAISEWYEQSREWPNCRITNIWLPSAEDLEEFEDEEDSVDQENPPSVKDDPLYRTISGEGWLFGQQLNRFTP